MDETIPLAVPDLRGNESVYLSRCIRDNWISSAGPYVTRCEDLFSDIVARDYAVATMNGTAALHLALIAAGVQPGDCVVVPDWTFVATANAVRHAGAIPIFADIDESSWTLDPGSLELAFAKAPRRVAAVIAVHTLGHPADIDPIIRICQTRGAQLIEDAAGAIGAQYKGRPAGSFGELAIFSFNGNKTLTAGGGGMVVVDDAATAARIRSLSAQARRGIDYLHSEVGFNYRMTNLNAAVLLAQIERLEEMLAAKKRIAATYDRHLMGRGDLLPMPRQPWALSGCWLYSVRCSSESAAFSLVDHLKSKKIESRVFWRSLSSQAPFSGFPVALTGCAGRLSGTVVSLPCSSSLSEIQQSKVLEALACWNGQP